MNYQDKQQKKKKYKKFRFKYFIYDFVKWTGALSAFLALRPKVIYENKQARKVLRGPAVLVANHESVLDPIKIHFSFWYRRIHLVATSQLFDTKVKNWFFHKVLCIPVNREHLNIQTYRDVSDRLNEGAVVGIFPEGGLKNNEQGQISSFKAGAVIMALKNNAPVVPVYIKKPLHWYNRQRIVVGEPVVLDSESGNLPLSEVEKISSRIREKEIELIKLAK